MGGGLFAGGGYRARGIEGAYGSWGPEWSGNQETDGVGWDGEVEKLWKLGNYGDGWGGGATERGTTGGRGKRRTGRLAVVRAGLQLLLK